MKSAILAMLLAATVTCHAENQQPDFVMCGQGAACRQVSIPAQTWQSLTAQRSLGGTYKNDTSLPINISVQTYSGCIVGVGPTECNPTFANPNPLHCAVSIRVDGVLVDYQFQNSPRENSMCSAKAVIPPGAQYVVGADGWDDIFLFNWAELR